MRNNILVFLFLSLLVVSCQDEPEQNLPEDQHQTKVAEVEKETPLEIVFDETKFEEDTMKGLLKELGLGMCNPKEKDLSNYKKPACDPKFFKLLPYRESMGVENAFILVVKSMVHDFPVRRVFVFQREKGKLVKVNGFIANLIGKRKSNSDFEDLILRFADRDQNHFNCLYVWKNNQYQFEKVEQINDSNIKAEFQDSMNMVIMNEIQLNNMQF